MKNIKKIYTASLLLLSSIITFGQKHTLDSINVQIDNEIELSINIYEYSRLTESLEKDLKSLQALLKDNSNIPASSPYSIIYAPNKSLSIKQTVPIEKIIWENGKQSTYHFSNQCNIRSDKYFLKIKYNELKELVSDSLIVKVKGVVDSTIAIQGRYSMTYNYSFHGNNQIHDEQIYRLDGQRDILCLKAGVGVNLIKNQPVIDLAAEMGLIFTKKGILKNQYYFSYNQLSDFSDNSKVNTNGFANIGYRYNLSKTKNNVNWLGIELGYLTIKNGNMFEKNTFRLGVNWGLGKYMTIAPQLYFSGNSTYPAMRIGFGL
jgi:hypothetical protein